LASYYLVVAPDNLMMLSAAITPAGMLLELGTVIAIAITTFLMLWFQVSHPPACATTLIISLGFLPHWQDGLAILIAVIILYYAYWAYPKITSDSGLPE